MSPQNRSSPRTEAEDRWRIRLAEAKRSYDFAMAQFHRASATYRAAELPTSDGNLYLHQAIAAESTARREYIRILRLFSDLIVHGRIPKDEPPGGKRA